MKRSWKLIRCTDTINSMTKEETYQYLDDHGISYEKIEHQAVWKKAKDLIRIIQGCGIECHILELLVD